MQNVAYEVGAKNHYHHLCNALLLSVCGSFVGVVGLVECCNLFTLFVGNAADGSVEANCYQGNYYKPGKQDIVVDHFSKE